MTRVNHRLACMENRWITRTLRPEQDLDVVTFLIGGGQPPNELRIHMVDGQPVRHATSCNGDWLGQRV